MIDNLNSSDLAKFAGIGIAVGALIGYINHTTNPAPKKYSIRDREKKSISMTRKSLKRKPTDKYMSNDAVSLIEDIEDEKLDEEEQEIVLIKLVQRQTLYYFIIYALLE